jgi:two-component system response regulator FlrC
VENDETLRRMMVSTLRGLGFSTLEAENGGEALAKFRAHELGIDLAIIEFQIPAMSGLDVAAELERLQPGINILYMSALHDSIAMESIGSGSPDRVLLKPFDSEALGKRAKYLLRGASRGERGARRHAHGRTAGSAD